MIGPEILWGAAFCLYGLANVFFLLEIWLHKRVFALIAAAFSFAGIISHLSALILRGYRLESFPVQNLHDSLGLFAVLVIAAYFAVQIKWRFQGLGFFAASLAFLATLISYAYPSKLQATSKELTGLTLQVHITIILLSFGVFALAFCASLAYLLQDFLLHSKHNIRLSKRLPPLNVLDSLINKLVGLGFVLLSVGIALGSIWADRVWGSWWSFDPKQMLALLTWIVYAIYIHARTLSGWKGKKRVVWIVLGFLLVVATFLSTNLLPGRHRFV